eukprot:1981900-Pleurochrysis_carterae.AAC.1
MQIAALTDRTTGILDEATATRRLREARKQCGCVTHANHSRPRHLRQCQPRAPNQRQRRPSRQKPIWTQ